LKDGATPVAEDWEQRPRKRDNSKVAVPLMTIHTLQVLNIDEDSVYSVFVSYVEIYNNYIYDLLEPTAAK
jgi:hypothetical protein